MGSHRVLVAGIGNIFLGDDAFGVEVARKLMRREWPEDVQVTDFGIRGFDLAYALLDSHDVVFLVDAAPRGGVAGTLYLIEPELKSLADRHTNEGLIEAHSMNPAKVLRLAKVLGAKPRRIVVLGCEPAAVPDENEVVTEMSAPVRGAVDRAVEVLTELIGRALTGGASVSFG